MKKIPGIAIKTDLSQKELEKVILSLDMSCRDRFAGGFGVIKSAKATNLFEFRELDCAPSRTFSVWAKEGVVYVNQLAGFIIQSLLGCKINFTARSNPVFPPEIEAFLADNER